VAFRPFVNQMISVRRLREMAQGPPYSLSLEVLTTWQARVYRRCSRGPTRALVSFDKDIDDPARQTLGQSPIQVSGRW
jgi:hypothetical protein